MSCPGLVVVLRWLSVLGEELGRARSWLGLLPGAKTALIGLAGGFNGILHGMCPAWILAWGPHSPPVNTEWMAAI